MVEVVLHLRLSPWGPHESFMNQHRVRISTAKQEQLKAAINHLAELNEFLCINQPLVSEDKHRWKL